MEKIYAIYDEKAECYGVLFTAASDGCALRVFDHLLKTDTQKIALYPEDFTLVCVGDWDTDRGYVSGVDSAKPVTTGISRIAYFRSLREAVAARTTPPTEDCANA